MSHLMHRHVSLYAHLHLHSHVSTPVRQIATLELLSPEKPVSASASSTQGPPCRSGSKIGIRYHDAWLRVWALTSDASKPSLAVEIIQKWFRASYSAFRFASRLFELRLAIYETRAALVRRRCLMRTFSFNCCT